jgi:hypothetical protein
MNNSKSKRAGFSPMDLKAESTTIGIGLGAIGKFIKTILLES